MKQTYRYREHFEGFQEGGSWGMGEKGEGIQKYKLAVTQQSWGCKAQYREIVNNIVITMYGVRWVLDLSQ